MEKEYLVDESMNSTGISIFDDVYMDMGIQTEIKEGPTKRRKLIEQFDNLCIQDEEELLM